MRTTFLAAIIALLLAIPASSFAEDEVKPEQLKKMYDDALGQLKAAQDRKAELAKENESLTAKVQELQKQLAAAQDQVQSLKTEVADNADRTYYLRAYRAAWQQFLARSPELLARWKNYLGHSALAMPADSSEFLRLDLVDLKIAYSKDNDAADAGEAQAARFTERAEAAGSGGQ
jgi:septal ring factor EnvC (AmiA/AmiB activator)